MRIFDLNKAGTKELLNDVKKLIKGTGAFAFLAGLCLAVLTVSQDSIDTPEKILFAGLVVGFFAMLIFQYWWFTRKLLPELAARCSDIQMPKSDVNQVDTFRRQQWLGKIGMGIFLMSIPAFIVAALLGYPPFLNSGLPTVAGWLVIVCIVAPGLYLIFRGALCPQCKNLIRSSYDEATHCPHCGARIRDDV